MTVEAHFKMAEIPQPPLPKRHDLQTSADLERVTDYAEEQEISTTDIENVSFVLLKIESLFSMVLLASIS